MRALLALLAIALLGIGAMACANGGKAPGSASQHSTKRDRDNDGDHNDDDGGVLGYGHAANTADRQVLTLLIKHYYAAAAADDGARSCAMLDPLLAGSVAEEYGRVPALRGTSCAAVLTKLFRHHHQLLADKSATLKVYAMRVKGEKALVVLSFATLPEVRQTSERRYGGTWKIRALTDGIVE